MGGGIMGGIGAGTTGSGTPGSSGNSPQTPAGRSALQQSLASYQHAQPGIRTSNQLAGNALNTMGGGVYNASGGGGVGGFMQPPPKPPPRGGSLGGLTGGTGGAKPPQRLGPPLVTGADMKMGAADASGISSMAPASGQDPFDPNFGNRGPNIPSPAGTNYSGSAAQRTPSGVGLAGDSYADTSGTIGSGAGPGLGGPFLNQDPFGTGGGTPEPAGNPSDGSGGLVNPTAQPPGKLGGPTQTNGGSPGSVWDQYPTGDGGKGGPFSPPTGSGTGIGGGLGGGGSGGNSGSGSGAGGATSGDPFGVSSGGSPDAQGNLGDHSLGGPAPPGPPGQPGVPGNPGAQGPPGTSGGVVGGGGMYGGLGGTGLQGMTYQPPQSVGSEGYSTSQGESGGTNTSHGESQNTSVNQSTGASTSGSTNQSTGSGSSFSNPFQSMTYDQAKNFLGGGPAREANAADPFSRQQFSEETNRENAQIGAQANAQLEDLMAKAKMQGMDPNSPAILQARQQILQNRGAQELANTSKQDAAFRQQSGAFNQANAGQNINQRGQDLTKLGLDTSIINGLTGQQTSGSQNQNQSLGSSFGQSQQQSTGNSQGTSFTDANGQQWSRNNAYSQWQPVFGM